MVWETLRACPCRIGSPALRAITDREERSASLCSEPTGARLRSRPPIPSGSPEKPLTSVQLEAKFRDCARHAVRPLSDASVDGLLAAIGRFETLPDARELMTAVAG